MMDKAGLRNVDPATVAGFGLEWSRFQQEKLSDSEAQALFDAYFAEFPWQALPPDAVGFDAGCGSGRWARLVAPSVGLLHCIDASEAALAVAQRRVGHLPNCEFHLASVADPPFPPSSMDFGYSLGVLHHVPDPLDAMRACVRLLKPGAPFLVYMYYALEDRPLWYRGLWRASDMIRRGVSRMPHRLRYAVSEVFAAGVYWPLARTARLLEMAGRDVSNFPLSLYRERSFYTMRTDALDRLGTKVEHRFTAAEIAGMMVGSGLTQVRVLDGFPYWRVLGYRA
jgi:SAM-dependent methyltransferase